MKRSPLAPDSYQTLPPIDGVRIASMEAGIKYSGRHDLMLMVFDEPSTVAGVFTSSRCASAPVDWCRARLGSSANPKSKALVVNSGNANAFTGKRGADAADETAAAAAAACGCDPSEIYLASTGVIGEPLDASQFSEYLEMLAGQAVADNWHSAAETIMTTDTYPKLVTTKLEIDGVPVLVNGIAKGSGMIAPDMATMLSFVVTDMPITQPILQSLLSDLTRTTFNAITVDSDTSTSDTLMAFSTGRAPLNAIENLTDPRLGPFREALNSVLHNLAMQIVRDGEGASKHVEVCVQGAQSNDSARTIARSIADSPLVKTAIAGEDANWGRVVMAVGKAGEPADRDKLSIWFGDIRVATQGERDPDYSESAASAVMKDSYIRLTVDLEIGTGSATLWTCDLTKEYVAINGDYRS